MLRTILVFCALALGFSARGQQAPAPGASKAIVFEATASAVRPGESVGLRWEVPSASRVRLDPGGLVMDAKGQVTVKPSATTVYTLTEAKAGGVLLGRVEIRIEPYAPYGEPAKVCAFEASTHAVLPGEPVKLSWTCTGTAKVKLEPGGLELDGQSDITVTPLETTRYTITATNISGGASRTVEVQVLKSPVGQPARVCAFTAERGAIRPGEPVELRWECVGDSKVRLEPGGLELDGKDHVTVQPTETTVYTLSAANVLGGSSRSLEVRVIPGLPEKMAAVAAKPGGAQPARDVPRTRREQPQSVPPATAPKPEMDKEGIASPSADTDAKIAAFRDANLPLAMALGESQRTAAAPGSWTLRLVVSGSLAGLKVLAKHGSSDAEELMVLPFVRKDGIRWWQACYGAFPSRTAAMKAYTKLPDGLRRALSTPLALHLDRLPGDLPKALDSKG